LVIILALVIVLFRFFLQEEKSEEGIRPGAEEDFYTYLGLPSVNGKFLELNEAESEITILYFDTETMKIARETFKIDGETVFSKARFEPQLPDLFPKEDLRKVKQETQITAFYSAEKKEGEPLLARLIQVRASF